MSPKELTAFRMAPELMDALRRIKERDGVPVAVQIDRAVREYLAKRGVKLGPLERGRVSRKKRP